MERVLLDSSTLMSAAGLLRGEQKPSAYNIVALASLVESVILHDSVLVLDTIDPYLPDSRLHAAAETHGAGAITVIWTTTDVVVEGYISLENPEVYKRLHPTTELPNHEAQYQQAVDEAQKDLASSLYTQRHVDYALARYLNELDERYEEDMPTLPDQTDRPFADAEGTEEQERNDEPQLEEFVRGTQRVNMAFDNLESRYTLGFFQPYTPWIDPEDPVNAMRYSERKSKLLFLRAHFYILASEVLAAPYRPDGLRTPICTKYFGDGTFSEPSFEERMVDAAEALTKARIKHISDFIGKSAFAALPFFLARVFYESRSPEDVINVTRQLRESDEAACFREHLRHLRQAEEGEDIETIYKEIMRYEALLRRAFGEGERSLEVLWSIGASAGKAAALQTPAATADLAATALRGLTSAPAALARWWYGRKVALMSKTIRQGKRARGLQAEIERLFGAKLNQSDIHFLEYLDEVTNTRNSPEDS